MKIFRATRVALVVACVLLAACGDDGGTTDDPDPTDQTQPPGGDPPAGDDAWADIVAAAEEEGRVVLYSSSNPAVIPNLEQAFERDYPEIDLVILPISPGDLIARVDRELETDTLEADVTATVELAWYVSMSERGLLVPPAGPSAEGWPERFTLGEDGSVILPTAEPSIVTYNTSLLDEPITEFEDLLRPDLADGRIGVLGFTANPASTTSSWWDHLEESYGTDFVEGLAAQNPRIYPASSALQQAVASGEITVAAFSTAAGTITLRDDEGAPIDYFVPTPTWGFAFGAAALADAANPNAALVLLDWMMSEAGQTAWHVGLGTGSPIAVEGALDAGDFEVFDHTAYDQDRIDEVVARFEGRFL